MKAILLLLPLVAATPAAVSKCTAGSRVINGRQCSIKCNIDHPGGDYGRTYTGSFESCIQACASDRQCVTAQYHKDNGYCYFKNALNRAQKNQNDNTVICKAIPACSNGDKCVVAAKNLKQQCSTFQKTTVTPCPTTVTVTPTTTITEPATTTTITSVITTTDTDTNKITITSTITIELTATTVVTSELDITETITDQTITVTETGPRQKRALSTKPLPVFPSVTDLQRRATTTSAPSTCKPTTGASSSLPRSASACSNSAYYSSACSCLGVTRTLTTLAPVTSTVSSTSTVRTTPTSTATTFVTTATTLTVDETQTVPTNLETTVATETLTDTSTNLVTVTETATVTQTVAPPVCSAYRFVAASGTYAGQVVSGGQPDTSQIAYGFVYFSSDASTALSYTIRSDGKVYANNVYGWTTRNSQLYYILQMTDYSQSTYGIPFVTCSISPGGTTVPGAVGTLSCNVEGSPSSLLTCIQTANNLVQTNGQPQAGCTSVTIAAIPFC